MSANNMIYILLLIFLAYRIFRRVQRTFGWQQLSLRRLRIMNGLFCVIGLLFLIEGVFHWVSLVSDVIGASLGIILAYYSAETTRFEIREGLRLYRSSAWIGGTVTLLFIGRLSYRIYAMMQDSHAHQLSSQWKSLGGTWTSGLMLIMIAYYFTYNLFLIRKQKQLNPA
ncbi:hypothetical protein [Paenibacillus aceris]|uniref:Membrane protein CcdC involved in cytochrome C biogenesis n=1 Tax=Paenibacillus aceris TaxID=869555 RepID=A0ABS4I736_9BACL|nr:hypothetical protein [Paenibacillus aceris]MBP1966715.1 membrane protein CcdC involved in cytochrome C biogenesis [Paenibacillus aceris]NHW34977.1 hypothetical protein [Paenibacillus aceris]